MMQLAPQDDDDANDSSDSTPSTLAQRTTAPISLDFSPHDAKIMNTYIAMRHKNRTWEGVDAFLGLDRLQNGHPHESKSDNTEHVHQWMTNQHADTDAFLEHHMHEYISQLANVPKLFFSDSFNLHHDATFNQLIAKYRISTLVQQEKLEYWNLVVESCLALQLSMRSNDIFEILSEFDDLEVLLNVCWEGSHNLNELVESLQTIMIEQPRKILQIKEEREMQTIQLELLNKMHHVLECVDMLDTLQESHQYHDMIILVRQLEGLLDSELMEITALGEVRSHLRSRMNSVRKSLTGDTLNLIAFPSSSGAPLNYHRLRPYFSGLVELKALRSVLETHKDQIKTRIFTQLLSECLHLVMPEINSAHQFESKQLSNILRALDKSQFLKCIDLLFSGYLDIMLHERRLSDTVVDFAKEAHAKLKTVDTDTKEKMLNDARTNLGSMMQLCHSRCSLVFSIQSGNMERLTRTELIQLMTKINRFITKSDTILATQKSDSQTDQQTTPNHNRPVFSSLKATIFAHGRVYMDKFHATKLSALQSAIYNDSWVWNENNQEVQDFLNNQFALHPPSPDDSKYLWINEEPFCVASSTLVLLSLLSKYFELFDSRYAAFFQPLDICDRVIKLVTEYNKEVRQQILGAQALERNLKTIKVGHLMLVSEITSFLSSYVPLVKTLSAKHLPEKHQYYLVNFDNLISDFDEHHRAILLKVQDIMRFMLKNPLSTWSKMQWEDEHMLLPSKPIKQMALFMKRVFTKLKQYLLDRNRVEFVRLFTQISDHYLLSIEREMDGIISNSGDDEIVASQVLSNLRQDITEMEASLERFQILIADFDDEKGGVHHRLLQHWRRIADQMLTTAKQDGDSGRSEDQKEKVEDDNEPQATFRDDSTSTNPPESGGGSDESVDTSASADQDNTL